MPPVSGSTNQQTIQNIPAHTKGVEKATKTQQANGKAFVATGSAEKTFQGFSVQKGEVQTKTLQKQMALAGFGDTSFPNVNIGQRSAANIFPGLQDKTGSKAVVGGSLGKATPSADAESKAPPLPPRGGPALPPRGPALPPRGGTNQNSGASDKALESPPKEAAPPPPSGRAKASSPPPQKKTAFPPPPRPRPGGAKAASAQPPKTDAKSGGKSVQFDLAPAGKMAPMNQPKSALKSALKSAPANTSSAGEAAPPLPQRKAASPPASPAQASPPPPPRKAVSPPASPASGRAQASPPLPQRKAAAPPPADIGVGRKAEVKSAGISEVSDTQMAEEIFSELSVITDKIVSKQTMLEVTTDLKKKFRYPTDKTVGKIPVKTAVKLPTAEGGTSQRLQGNYVRLHSGEPLTIATQAPKPGAMGDFWLASFSHDSKAIVDLTQSDDMLAGKVHVYYPTGPEPMSFESGGIKLNVSLLSETPHPSNPDIKTSSYLVVDDKGNEKEMSRVHFSGWIDHAGVDAEVLNQIIDTVDDISGQEGAVTVHCSAGVGRTGTFITARTAKHQLGGQTMDSAQIKDEILDLATKGREQRNKVFIQKPEQMSTLISFFKNLGNSG